MGRSAYVLCMLVIMLCSAGSSYSGVSQFFDSEGNLTASAEQKPPHSEHAVRRYSVPEGIRLYDDVTYEYYPVFGKTFSALVSSSRENGPYDRKEKKRLSSRTDWKVGWTYRFAYSEPVAEAGKLHAAVEIFDINITDEITITIPTVLDNTVLNSVEKKLWENYLGSLLNKEHNLVKKIRDASSRDELIRRLESIDYLILEYKEGMNVEQAVSRMIEEKTLEIGREWIKKIKAGG